TAGTASAQGPSGLEVRFCPSAQVRTYPLESQRGIQGLILQNAVVINRSSAPVELVGVDIALLQTGQVSDSRHIEGAELARIGAGGPRLQASGMMQLAAFQFCGKALVGEGVKLAGPKLAPGEAMLLTTQPFAFKGKRDELRLSAKAT